MLHLSSPTLASRSAAAWIRVSIVAIFILMLGSYSIVSAKVASVIGLRCLSEFGYGTCTDATTAPTGVKVAVDTSAQEASVTWDAYTFADGNPTTHYMLEVAQTRGQKKSSSTRAFARRLQARGGTKSIMKSYTGITETTKTISTSIFKTKGVYFVRVIAVDYTGSTSRWSKFKQFQIKSAGQKDSDKKDKDKGKDKGRK